MMTTFRILASSDLYGKFLLMNNPSARQANRIVAWDCGFWAKAMGRDMPRQGPP
jgi:hypothetical protein